MDKFEKLIKDAVGQYEVPYTDAAWHAFSKKLGPEKGLVSRWLIGISAIAVVATVGVWYFLPTASTIYTNMANTTAQNINKLPATNVSPITIDHKILKDDEAIKSNADNLTTATQANHQVDQTEKTTQKIKTIASPDNQEAKTINTSIFEKASVNPAQNNLPLLEPLDENNVIELAAAQETIDYTKYDLKVVSNATTVCLNETIHFTPSIPKITAKYQFDMGDGTLLLANMVDYQYAEPGTYHVSINLLDNQTNEILHTSELKTIEVLALPKNAINVEIDNDLIPTAYVSLVDDELGESVNWEIAQLYKTNTNSFKYSFKEKGAYALTCTLTGRNGCKHEIKQNIVIENDYNLLAPNAFSPNGDLLNDYFIPKALLVDTKPFTMSIYNKAGALMYQTNEATRPWDGLYTKDRTQAPSGIYIWVVEQTNEFGETEVYQGHVTITR